MTTWYYVYVKYPRDCYDYLVLCLCQVSLRLLWLLGIMSMSSILETVMTTWYYVYVKYPRDCYDYLVLCLCQVSSRLLWLRVLCLCQVSSRLLWLLGIMSMSSILETVMTTWYYVYVKYPWDCYDYLVLCLCQVSLRLFLFFSLNIFLFAKYNK